MAFNSLEYAAFLTLVWLCYWRLNQRWQNHLLLVASYAFYAVWDARFVALIAFATAVDHVGARLMKRSDAIRGAWISWLCCLMVSLGTVSFDLRGWLGWSHGPYVPWSLEGIRGLAPAAVALCAVLQLGLGHASKSWPDALRRRVFLGASLLSNLGLLAAFKYCDFFIGSARELLAAVGVHVVLPELHLLLPVGLSFFTFQSLSYVVDVYRGDLEPIEELSTFALFVAYFPQLVAGPIMRPHVLAPQLQRARSAHLDSFTSGLSLILVGLLKKVAIADTVAHGVAFAFTPGASPSGATVFWGTVLFSLQIACDFSGYTDLARGSSRLLGIELVPNFDLPYTAKNPQDFWRRWHMSLSTWLRDYVYIPLGGNRKGAFASYRNLWLTMLLGGLWHGAAWHYVFWGAYHGVGLGVHRWLGARTPPHSDRRERGTLLRRAACLLFVGYGWLLFRAQSLRDVANFSTALIRLPSSGLRWDLPRPSAALFIALPTLMAFIALKRTEVGHRLWRWTALRGAAYAAMIVAITIAAGDDAPPEFIYFQF